MNTRSIRYRLTTWYSTALIISIAVIFASFYYITRQELYRHTDIILTSHARVVAQNIHEKLEARSDISEESSFYNEFGAIPGMMLVVTDDSGFILHSTYPYETIQKEVADLFWERNSLDHEVILNKNFSGTTQRMILISIGNKDELLGMVMMGHPIDVIQKSLNSLLINLISLFMVLVFPTIFGGWVLAKRAMQQVNAISEQMQRISSENLTERIKSPQTRDEIEALVSTFNNLLGRLGSAFRRERQFIEDVAHELKTPLATQRSTIEVLLLKKRTNEAYRKSLQELLVENEKLTCTVKDVLDLAWAEADTTNVYTDKVNLTDVMEELYEIAVQLGIRKKLQVTKRFVKDIFIVGNREKIFRALLNIVDNAIKYTTKGNISLSMTTDSGKAIVKIKDTGEGISGVDEPHIFRRFYRGKKAYRSDGSGLGLAISYSIITASKGALRVLHNDGGGTTMVATFPMVEK